MIDYVYDLELLGNTLSLAEFLLHHLEQLQTARGIGLCVNAEKTVFMGFKQDGGISRLNGQPLKLVDRSHISTETSHRNIYDEIKWDSFRFVAVLVLLYGCTTCNLTKRFEKIPNLNYTRMPRTVLNKFWKQYPTKQPLSLVLLQISQTIKIRWWRRLLEK